MKKKMLQVDVWHSSGAHAGWHSEDPETNLMEQISKYGKPSPYQLGQFRLGYQVGKANSAINGIQRMFRDMKTNNIARTADELWVMYKQLQLEAFDKIVIDEHGIIEK